MARTILITGGSGKFGKAMVNYFLAAGDCVLTTCHTTESLDRLTKEYKGFGETFNVIKVDLVEDNSIVNLLEQLDSLNIQPDCLINNARSQKFLSVGLEGLVLRSNFMNEYLLDVIVPYELTMALVHQKIGEYKKA